MNNTNSRIGTAPPEQHRLWDNKFQDNTGSRRKQFPGQNYFLDITNSWTAPTLRQHQFQDNTSSKIKPARGQRQLLDNTISWITTAGTTQRLGKHKLLDQLLGKTSNGTTPASTQQYQVLDNMQ
jgi:hypothetical protein